MNDLAYFVGNLKMYSPQKIIITDEIVFETTVITFYTKTPFYVLAARSHG